MLSVVNLDVVRGRRAVLQNFYLLLVFPAALLPSHAAESCGLPGTDIPAFLLLVFQFILLLCLFFSLDFPFFPLFLSLLKTDQIRQILLLLLPEQAQWRTA